MIHRYNAQCYLFLCFRPSSVFEQTWEAKEFTIDGSFCAEDVDTFGVGYSVRPCLETLGYTASGSEDEPEILFVSLRSRHSHW